ncbi:MAG: hypothetical protein LBT58_04190 [Endomicrobium sp.]|nr:hypothetical protein [Endomicrobium sp.]
MNVKQKFSLPPNISYPQKQTFTLNGDGAFSKIMQNIIAQVKYNLPIM